MIVRSFNPIECGRAAIWLDEPIRHPSQVLRLARQLRDYPEPHGLIDIVVAGGGGACGTGLEMYCLIRETVRRTRVTIIDAPSMSGVIAMAGDHIRIVEGGSIFLHHSGYAADFLLNAELVKHIPAATLRSLARGCDATDATHVAIFARRTGLAPHVIRELRASETTLDATTAVQLGFADDVVKWGETERGHPSGTEVEHLDGPEIAINHPSKPLARCRAINPTGV